MTFTPYLYFDGQAEAALRYYAETFGADELTLMPYHEAPDSEALPKSDNIMYGHIMLGEACLMASDVMPGVTAGPQQAVSINFPVATVEEGQDLFDRLSEGGTVTMPYGPVFFSKGFGMVK
ncbi:MAG: VOC family protein, partial [Pseudomonadota bacterium]|nr:VOC family protein [Pseudomonadota bacterium]